MAASTTSQAISARRARLQAEPPSELSPATA
jgi:hypothetical protein